MVFLRLGSELSSIRSASCSKDCEKPLMKNSLTIFRESSARLLSLLLDLDDSGLPCLELAPRDLFLEEVLQGELHELAVLSGQESFELGESRLR